MSSKIMVTYIILITLLTAVRQTGSAGIIAPPMSVNVTTGLTATFQCTTEGGALYWIINETSNPSEWGEGINYDTRQSGTYQISTLSITAATETMTIRCAVRGIESGTAYLLIQGLLHAPTDVSVVSNHTTILLTWQEPYTLDITGVEPDISHYEVNIKNVDNEQYFSVNTSVATYSLDQQSRLSSQSTACSVFEFQIAAVNLAGIGEKSEAVYGSFYIAPMLKVSVSSDLQSALLTCNASCFSDFILWFVNHTILNDVTLWSLNNDTEFYYHKTSNRGLNCFSPESNAELSNTNPYYTESLQVMPMQGSYSGILSCATIFACTREEILNEDCTPKMCYSTHEEEISLVTSTEVIHTSSTSHATDLLVETSAAGEDLNMLKDVIIGLGVVMILLLIITATVMTVLIGALIKYKKGNLRKTNGSQIQEATVIYEEPKSALPQPALDRMQQCPAYRIAGQCAFRRSQI